VAADTLACAEEIIAKQNRMSCKNRLIGVLKPAIGLSEKQECTLHEI
jgi:hypothetical protein